MGAFSVGVITISDRCASGEAVDSSGPRLRELANTNFDVYRIEHIIIPDDLETIEKTLLNYVEDLKLNLILTTGGTGFSRRDVTPEATRRVIIREAPQLTLAMALVSFQKTNFAALSRAVCGIRNDSLIVNMPGSKKAIEECFDAIKGVIPHAIDLITGENKGVTFTHRVILNNSANLKPPYRSVPHICPHKTSSGGKDDRNSPFPMITVDSALEIILKNISDTQSMPEICSPINIPEFRASIKDGYAVKSSGGKGVKRVNGYVSAGEPIRKKDFKEDECFKINTGAPVPDFADCIIQVEDTKLIKTDSGGGEQEIEILIDPVKDLDIRPIGIDLSKGENIFRGITTYPGTVAYKSLLASCGMKYDKLPHENASIVILSTGDEIIAPGESLKEGGIYDSNTTMLKTLLEQHGFHNVIEVKVKDTHEDMKTTIERTSICKFVICSGSVSMGDKDFLKIVLTDLNYNIHFGRVNMKPGKPMTFATNAEGRLVFGLPGNPVSAFVTFRLFVLPALRKFSGYNKHQLSMPTIQVELLNDSLDLDPRPEYVRARIISKKGKLFAEVTDNQMSSRLTSIAGADVLINLPGRTAEKTTVKAGECLLASILKQYFISAYE